jgi:hypothetical protein
MLTKTQNSSSVRKPSWLGLLAGLIIVVGSAQVQAQTGSITGRLIAVTGDTLTIETSSGPTTLQLSDRTVIRAEVPSKFSELTNGMYVGVTAAKQPDGVFRASRLHIFSEDQRGSSEGHRPLSSAPQSGLTMTNANVEAIEDVVVQDIKARMLTLKYKGGEIKVLVPPDTPVVKRVVGDRTSLKTGAELSIQPNQTADGSVTASQITVRAPR